jgi:guanylate cyclase
MTGHSFVSKLIGLIARIGADPADGEDLRLQKRLLVACTLLFLAPGAVWGLIYFLFDESVAAMIPWAYVIASPLSLLAFAYFRNYPAFRFRQLLFILLLPFLLQLALGGFIPSSAVVLWSLICPIGALIFAGPRHALRWFAAYVALVAISGFAQVYVRTGNNLPDGLVITFFVLNITTISAIVFLLLAFFIDQRDLAYRLLHAEREKSENLLLNILPKEIASLLKENSGTIADYYDDVSVLFADIVNFTPLAEKLRPRETVALLNEIFSTFDALVDEYGVEKIETVGDEYMAACGVPRRCPDHAGSLARLALRMCAYIASLPPTHDGRRLDIRIGIHSGPVVAGVIGRKKFAFELFGDTVNTAHRMQSHGVPGRIHISRVTYELLKDDFICEPRGDVAVKGKGEMETWFVKGEKDSVVEASPV